MSVKDGGAAFPRAGFGFAYRDEGYESEGSQDGMALRDYFAAKALAGLCAGIDDYSPSRLLDTHGIALDAYALADDMLKVRSVRRVTSDQGDGASGGE